MPSHPARVADRFRETERRRLAELRDAEHEPEHREHAAEPGRPHHGPIPERLIHAQRRDVEPVRNRRDPCERARASRGHERDRGVGRGNVHLGAAAVVDGEFLERQRAAHDQRPLVRSLDGADEGDVAERCPDEARGDRFLRVDVLRVEQLARVREHRRRAAAAAEAIGGPAEHGEQRDLARTADLGRRERFGRREPHGREIELRQVLEPLLLAELRHAARHRSSRCQRRTTPRTEGSAGCRDSDGSGSELYEAIACVSFYRRSSLPRTPLYHRAERGASPAAERSAPPSKDGAGLIPSIAPSIHALPTAGFRARARRWPARV